MDESTEELADGAISGLRDFMDTEAQLVQEAHDLHTKLLAWDYIVLHLDEIIPPENVELTELTGAITDKLTEIRDLVESGKLQGLRIIREEEEVLSRLQREVEHRDWRAVKEEVSTESRREQIVIRLEEEELKELHGLFMELMKLMKKSENLNMKEGFTVLKAKSEYDRLEEYYLLQVYTFIRAYERIFRHLWRKEQALAEQ